MRFKYIPILFIFFVCHHILAVSYHSISGEAIAELSLDSDNPEAVFAAIVPNNTDEKIVLTVPKSKYNKEQFLFKNTSVGVALQEAADRYGLHVSIIGSSITFTIKTSKNVSSSFDHFIVIPDKIYTTLKGGGFSEWLVQRGVILLKGDGADKVLGAKNMFLLKCNETEWRLTQSILLLNSRGIEINSAKPKNK